MQRVVLERVVKLGHTRGVKFVEVDIAPIGEERLPAFWGAVRSAATIGSRALANVPRNRYGYSPQHLGTRWSSEFDEHGVSAIKTYQRCWIFSTSSVSQLATIRVRW